MRDQITPLILTYNEAPNIGRTLEQLRWAHEIVVVDSFSTDQTLEIVSQFPQVRVFQRVFDDFVGQWDFGLIFPGARSLQYQLSTNHFMDAIPTYARGAGYRRGCVVPAAGVYPMRVSAGDGGR